MRVSSISILTLILSVGVGGCDVVETLDETPAELQPFVPGECGSWNPSPAQPASELPPPSSCGQDVCFVDTATAAGLSSVQFVTTSPADHDCMFARMTLGGTLVPGEECSPQWSSAGASVGDVDRDGDPDLFVTRLGAPDHLYLNRGDGSFDDVADSVGLGDCTWTNGSVFGDIDNDGDLDLLVTSLGGHRHQLWINALSETGELRFEDQAEARGFALTSSWMHGGQSVTLGDFNRDGWLDIHVNEWLPTVQLPAPGEPERRRHGARLLQNLGDGVFEDRSAALGVELDGLDELGIFAFSSTFVDLDDDGWQDLAITVDGGSSRLYWNRDGAGFEDGTELAGVNQEHSAMGSSFGDLDGDGRLDWFVTAIAETDVCAWDETAPCFDDLNDGNRLYLNHGQREFGEAARSFGVVDGGWGWGTSMFDFDNDGDLDVAMTNGWLGRDNHGGLSHQDSPSRLWRNDGDGQLVEVGEALGFDDTEQGRALLSFDADADGDLDVLIANHAGRPKLLRNDSVNDHAWLRVEVEGRVSNRDGRGAKVRVRARPDGDWQVREVGVGSHFLGEGELIQHFGLGPALDTVDRVEVEWPASGITQVFTQVSAGQTLHVVES